MRKFPHILLLIMLLVLPLRGMTAMLMPWQMNCHPVSMEMSHAGGHEHEHEQEHGHEHQPEVPQQDHGKCSVCGACCTSALTDTAPGGLFAHIQRSQLITFSTHPYTGFMPDSPDRPPKA